MPLYFLAVMLLSFGLAGCASAKPASTTVSPAGTDVTQLGTQQRLEKIATERQHDAFSTDFGIGPGDILQISVPDIDEQKREERVSPQGTIDLPIAGSINVSGLSEPQLRAAIANAYSKYIRDPEVDVFVKSYSSRQVAVIGMVNKPGLYTLNRQDETILDLIGRAGGMSESAGSLIMFVPFSANQPSGSLTQARANFQNSIQTGSDDATTAENAMAAQRHDQVGAEQPDKIAAANWSQANSGTEASPSDGDAIFITTSQLNRNGMDVPVRPGDLIMVPARGEVLVKGWVSSPGAYQITPGMTALGAIAAAGGQLYSSSAVVLRAGPDGQKIELPVNLSSVEKGQARDVLVQSGDVVIVQRSAVGALPYSIYFLLTRFSTGLAMPIY